MADEQTWNDYSDRETLNNAAVLTYHRMIDEIPHPRFYDVPWASFERQVSLISARTESVDGNWIRLDNGRAVMFSFDDGTADHVRAAEILSQYGFPGTFCVIGDRIDAKGFLTREDVEALSAAGHHIASHSVTHRRLRSIPTAELVRELHDSKTLLEAITGRPVSWLSLPGGAHDDQVLSEADKAGYEVVRSMDWGYTPEPARGLTKCLPVFRNYDDVMFRRLIDGRAPLWRYHAKSAVKRIVSEDTYHRLRDLAMGNGRRRSNR